MRFAMFASLTVIFLATAPVVRAQDKPAGVAAPAPAKEKLKCRSEVQIGSILRKRTCRTVDEWAALKARDEEAARRAMEDSGIKMVGVDPKLK